MNEIIKAGLSLMLVTLIASVMLAFAYQFTSAEIENKKLQSLKDSLKRAFPEADNFKEKNGNYEAYKEGKTIGNVILAKATGYSSTIEVLYGIGLDDKIRGIVILSQQETPGLGDKIAKDDFLSQFIGKSKSDIKLKKDDGSIDAVTGATISSRAVADSVRKG